ncbi:MAG: Sua5/YciO/YrdC/YwlC family protein, partial [Rhodospirillales bacterium]|nr:Sua5/YciO/YrdC/YwlC family protein [Rhodospirillales bacterium]
MRGIVQGVGFRPFVLRLAASLRLAGYVRNETGGVWIEVEGPPEALDAFAERLQRDAPPLSRIASLACEPLAARGESAFRIEASEADASTDIYISPDAAVCDDCLRELFDSADRRYRYPFLNCTNCGPRLTIVRGAPYDRCRTTMASFEMCEACRAEYEDPHDRRFHAQPTACPACGPQLALLDAQGDQVASDDPLRDCAAALREGRIAAIKGLGGFHLACDASNDEAVALLRERKHREEKSLAIMMCDAAIAEMLCHVDARERELLQSVAAPIVLLRRRDLDCDATRAMANAPRIADMVAPGNPHLGVMLPYTPLHHLLMREVNTPLVMTSAN